MNMHSLTRRTFTKSAVVASASFALDGFSQTVPSQPRVGIAPVGLGSIAEVFMRSVGKAENAKLTGLVTGHPAEKGKKFAGMYGVADSSIYTYETFDRIRNNHECRCRLCGTTEQHALRIHDQGSRSGQACFL
jgi:hypothetical protein